MRVGITGASGLVGSALRQLLHGAGDEVTSLVRGAPRHAREVRWDPTGSASSSSDLEGLDGLVHLAGRSVVALRWTPRVKEAIRGSRVDGTRNLVASLAQLNRPPRVFLCASAIGYYGSRGDEELDEESGSGCGFLAETAQAWEAAATSAEAWGARVVSMRIGVVLSGAGGALRAMLPAFRCGLGGPLGGGRQFFSWITRFDLVRAMDRLLRDPAATGAFNLVSPHPVRQREFARALGHELHRPAFLGVPALALKMALGEQARETLLASQRVLPTRILASGFQYRHAELPGALRFALGQSEGEVQQP